MKNSFLLVLSTAVLVAHEGQAQVWFPPPPIQVCVGKSTELFTDFQVQSVAVNPPEGLSTAIKELAGGDGKKARKLWSIQFLAAPDSRVGDRTVTLQGVNNQSRSETLRVVPHAPRLTDLTLGSVDAKGDVRLSFAVHDEGDDVGPNLFVDSWLDLGDTGVMAASSASLQKENDAGRVTISLGAGLGRHRKSLRSITVWISDTKGYRSNPLTITIPAR